MSQSSAEICLFHVWWENFIQVLLAILSLVKIVKIDYDLKKF